MRCNALDSLPGRAFGQYDSDCSAGNSDPFARALLSHNKDVVSEKNSGKGIIMYFSGAQKTAQGREKLRICYVIIYIFLHTIKSRKSFSLYNQKRYKV